MLHTQFRIPSSDLKPFVRFYTEREVQITGAVITHPVPARTCPMLGFSFRDSMTVKDNGQQLLRTSPKTVLVGPQTYHRVEMRLTGHLQEFYIMFRPEGFHRLFSVPMDQMTDEDYDARSVLGSFISDLEDRLSECHSFDERIRLVEHLFIKRMLQAPALDGVYFAAKQILENGGQASISALAHQSGLSLRQFERRFRKQIGVRPKLFTRIARFESALERKARLHTASWTDIALDFGYFDQMHMVHDFAEFTGKTPGESLAQLERLFVEPLRDARWDRARALAENNSAINRFLFAGVKLTKAALYSSKATQMHSQQKFAASTATEHIRLLRYKRHRIADRSSTSTLHRMNFSSFRTEASASSADNSKPS